jgi:hypothetical protein
MPWKPWIVVGLIGTLTIVVGVAIEKATKKVRVKRGQ